MPNGEVGKYKERLITRGFLQRHDFDYNKVYALVVKIETIRLILTNL